MEAEQAAWLSACHTAARPLGPEEQSVSNMSVDTDRNVHKQTVIAESTMWLYTIWVPQMSPHTDAYGRK